MMNHLNKVTVFAPATCANMAVGFDILGFAVADLGDEIILEKNDNHSLHIASIKGNDQIPHDVKKNTATVALQSMLDYLNLKQGFTLHINKNIPLSSGLGGSAASCVAALVSLNQFLSRPLPLEKLVGFALDGEQAACGVKHGDNVIPCLFGGISLIQSISPLHIVQLPLIPLHIVLLHPHIQLETRKSRAVLPKNISLPDHVKQSSHLASVISALYEQNYERFASACIDELIEPMRSHLIPGFYAVKSAAYTSGALACSISGSGPTLFAVAKSRKSAQLIAKHMGMEFTNQGIKWDAIVTTITSQGAKPIGKE